MHSLRPAVLFFACAFLLPAQSKRPLTVADFDSWRSIQSQTISSDGKWVGYALMPQVGDGEIVAREVATGKELRTPAGAAPPRSDSEDDPSGEERRPAPRGPKLEFTGDSRFLIAQTYPPKSASDAARKARTRSEDMPKNGMAIFDLAASAVTRVDAVKSFEVPDEAGNFAAYLKEGKEKTLVLRALPSASEKTFDGVNEFLLSRDGGQLAIASADAVFVFNTTAGTRKDWKTGKAKYTRLAFDLHQKSLAFLADGAVWGGSLAANEAAEWAKPPAGKEFSERAGLSFTRDGSKLVVGLATEKPKPAQGPEANPAKPADEEGMNEDQTRRPAARPAAGGDSTATPADENKAVFELWHWKDDRVQTIQKARIEQERNRSYRAILHLDSRTLVPLAGPDLPDVNLSDEGNTALGLDDNLYRNLAEFDQRYNDFWLVNPTNGERRYVVRKSTGTPVLSPDGKWAAYYDRTHWWSINTATGTATNLTAHLKTSFASETADLPAPPASYGSAGWSADSKHFLVHDRYDVWALTPDASAPRNITEGAGRKQGVQFRVVRGRPDWRERGINTSEQLLLRAENETTRETGFYTDSLSGEAEPQKLLMQPRNLSVPRKARLAGSYLLTASRFDQYPDLQVADASFKSFEKVSDANPQKNELSWGTAELMNFKNPDGVSLQASLFKPENFDATKKYPMMVYIYERLSNGVHSFADPAPSHSINRSFYVSNGYLVLFPDIAYKTGYPGESALQCVLAAVQKVVEMGFVDEKRIGIQGHSWGGYQIAYMVTRTNRFAAASPGALVSNMTSAYDGIRYGTGLPRQFQYERGQSRIGGSLWEFPMRFLENSAIFRADLIKTPLLMLHNDRDDAVPYTQGLEFFLALRRLNKEVYLFNYNGEPHGLRRRANQRDYFMRQFQFFEHYLKGTRRPGWMETGIRYIDREKPEAQAWQPASDAKQ